MNFAIGRCLAIGVLLGMISACAHQARDPSRIPPVDSKSLDSREMEGMASWYGQPHHGRRAASGEVYNMHRLTAAHRTLPFHTIVRVHNKRNGRAVDVRINDRGPFVKGRVIDLSYAAAKALDMLKSGTAPVRLKIVRLNAHYPEQEFAVQVAAGEGIKGPPGVRRGGASLYYPREAGLQAGVETPGGIAQCDAVQ